MSAYLCATVVCDGCGTEFDRESVGVELTSSVAELRRLAAANGWEAGTWRIRSGLDVRDDRGDLCPPCVLNARPTK